MNELLKILIEANAINFLIVIFAILFFAYKFNLKGFIVKTAVDIKNEVDKSSEEKENSQKALEHAINDIKVLPDKVDEILLSAKIGSESIVNKMKIDTENKIIDLKNNAAKAIDFETHKFKQQLSKYISEISIDLAEKNAKFELKDNTDLQLKFLNNALDEIDRLNFKNEKY